MTTVVVEISRVVPTAESVQNSDNSLAIPLTFFDLPWLLLQPVKVVFFYRLTELTRENFHSFMLPKLKLSLSLVLQSYLPLTGRVTWDPNDPKPSIVVSPNDGVSLTIAESEADFSHLSGYRQRPVTELRSLVPELPFSDDDSALVYSLQITLFPNQGFSIGFAVHHAVFDGKTATMFIRAWAHVCKRHLGSENRVNSSLPRNLTPSLDRSLVNDVTGLDEKMIELVRSLKGDDNTRSLSPIPTPAPAKEELGNDVVLSTLVLSRGDIQRLRERVPDQRLHLSTFVIAYAYVWTCLVKARGGDGDRTVSFLFVGDFRERLDPPLPATYFGNCVVPAGSYKRKAAEFAEEGGFVRAVEMVSELVKGLSSSRKIETIAEEFAAAFRAKGESSQYGTVAGLTGFGVYESDFGWGRPVKSDVISIQGEKISMEERPKESGGLEIGVCLKKTEMDIVFALFYNGLQKATRSLL